MTALSKELIDFAYAVCPERRDLFEAAYVSAFDRVARCLGPALCESRVPGSVHREQPVSHTQLALTVASQTLFILNADSSYRAWQQGQSSEITALWSRTAWRYALTLPVGYVVSHHSVRINANTSWNPALEDFAEFASGPAFDVLDSARTLAAPSLAFATYHRLFPNDLPAEPMLGFALADAFSAAPNPDNPLASSLRRALQKVIAPHRHMAYPYWWVLLHNEQLVHRDDFRPLQVNPQRAAPTPADSAPTSSAGAAPAALRLVPNASSPEAPAQDPSAPASPVDSPPPDPLAVGALQVAAGCVSQQLFKLNCKGALFHVFEGAVHLVVPGGWDRLAAQMQRPDIDGERLAARMRASAFVVPDAISGLEQFRVVFQPPPETRPIGTALLSRLSPAATRLLFPAGVPVGDNPAILRAP